MFSDSRRQRVWEKAIGEGFSYGHKLPDHWFRKCGFKMGEIVELLSDDSELIYHLQDEKDDSALPVAMVLQALENHLRQPNDPAVYDFVDSEHGFLREIDRLIYNLCIERNVFIGGERRQGRSNWFAIDSFRGDDAPFQFTSRLDDAVMLYTPPPDRIPSNPVAVCIEALRGWETK